MELKELYQEIILDHGINPRNKGQCKEYNREAKGHNPLCGDKIHLFLKLSSEKKIENVSFEGEGCAISLASASILTETIKGKEFNVASKIINDFLSMIKTQTKISINSLNEDQITTIMSLSGVKQFPMRVKCATMAWHTLNAAMEKKND
ncbi:SUF system NifU family Fe-S cluster assembly protein [Pelagibacteraceae bacterium]|jgi:nitrogen fixation NifU-like protein|nr:SUF system NifU family Fe-S cluster assembly protein [Pelagibacteraceae bacterium]|tara:strand:- start:1824 stop:2270 length:447 start_codon:yes stop_codon:yes gene_type:complete